MKKIIFTDKAPRPVGPYSQAVEVNGMLFVAGQVPLDPQTGRLVEGGIEAQTRQVMENTAAILKAAGYSFCNVVKSTCLLADMSDFQAMNGVYAEYYPTNPPARVAFAVKQLPLGALIEIETLALQ